MQRRSAQPGKYDISLPLTTKSTTVNTALVCRGAKRKDSGVISNFILLIIALRLLLPKRRGIMMANDKGRTGVQKTEFSPRDSDLNQCPQPRLPTSGRTLHSPTPHTLPGSPIPWGSSPLSLSAAIPVSRGCAWPALLAFPWLLSARRAAAPGAAGHPQQHRLSPLSLHGHDSENMECVLLLLFGDRIFCEVFVLVFF